ncbi:PepSY-associated TM helix domain-containing protein [Phenylobacterium sp.]|uniref:PepSY-associated TM helix domain-containing protein n=1 Tax=Phenylobacterium sp. TaxID=1871053 RepID=UPI003564523F
MTQSILARLRRVWLTLHLWLGVGLMVALVPLSVSGSLLVWHDALDHSVYAQRYAVSGPAASQPASIYAAATQSAFAGQADLTQLRLPSKAGDPVVAVGRIVGPPGANGRPRTLNAWIDPPTGKVLATAEIASSATMIIHRLHGQLLVPTVGRKIVGWLGWAMFVSSATGLWLWWPRHANVLKGLRWRRSPSTLFNLHHMAGFWICLPLAALSITGVYIAFPQTSHALVGAPPPPGPGMGARPARNDPRFAPPLAAPHLSVDEAVAAAIAHAPGASLASLNLPQQGNAPAWRVEVQPPGADPSRTIRIDDASGEVKGGRDRGQGAGPPRSEGGPDPFSRWVRRLHDGTDMGLAWRLVITAAGVAPLILSLSGLVMWLRRRGRRLALRHA